MRISAQGAEHLTMKIGRAYKHVREFDSLVVAHCTRSDLFTATGRNDIKNGRFIVRVEYAVLVGDILLSLGDFVYNLRSGLDQLAWQTVPLWRRRYRSGHHVPYLRRRRREERETISETRQRNAARRDRYH